MKFSAVVTMFVALAAHLQAAEIFPYGSGNWSYLIGRQEASFPVEAWRAVGFDDSTWSTGTAPIGYPSSDASGVEATIQTILPASSIAPTWTSVYFRKTFVLTNAAQISRLDLSIRIDDGFVAWINGVEIGRFSVPDGALAYNSAATVQGEVSEQGVSISNSGILVNGTNVIAIHGFNGATSSSDFFVDAALASQLDTPPIAELIDPTPGATVPDLTAIEVIFSENVTGVTASDLLINGSAIVTSISTNSPRDYTFIFPQPPTGTVTVAWAPGHGIADVDGAADAFVPGAAWNYTLDPNSLPSTFFISEFLTDNETLFYNGLPVEDEDGTRSDWIEIYNPSQIANSLNGWFLTDTPTNLTKWRFPSVVVPANKYLLVWASEKNRTNPAAPLHTNFRLSKNAGSYLALVDPNTNVVSDFVSYPAQNADISYGRDRVDPDLFGYFTTPTPGAQNATSGSGFAEEPTFSLESGIYTNNSLTLTITAPAGALIRYTFDGSEPTNGSLSAASPLNITFTTNMMVKARVFQVDQPSLWPSPVRARTFVMLDNTTRDFTSNLPILIISTHGRTIPTSVPPGGYRPRGTFIALDTFRGRTSLQGKADFQGLGQFEIFGQTSEGFAKKPYRVELNDELGNDRAASFLGLPAEADWNLRNPHNDKGFMNDFLGYELWEELGHYSCRRRYVEVFVDTGGGKLTYPGDYIGILVLFEHIEGGNNRVDISELTPAITNEPAISGGYIIKKDKAPTGGYSEPTFNTTGGAGHSAQNLRWHEPKAREITLVQSNWIRNYLNLFEASMYSANWTNATGTNHYSYYIDVDSFVDQHLHVEFTKQIDGYRLSSYYTKDRNGKLMPEPVWDWNLSFGNANYLKGGMTNGWYWADQGEGMTSNEHIWLRRLVHGSPNVPTATEPVTANVPPDGNSLGDPDFRQRITDRWAVLRKGPLNGNRVVARIDELSTLLAEAAVRNYAKYPGVLNTYQWPNPEGPPFHIDLTQPTYDLIVAEIKKWTKGRYLWMDAQFLRTPAFNTSSGPIMAGFQLQISAPVGSVYYTLDGTDPRAPGGAIAPGAQLYTGPVTLNANARVVARAYMRPTTLWTPWSAPVAGTFVVETPKLVVTEIMYHPLPPTPGPGVTNVDEDFEYVEVKNVGATPLNVNGFSLSGGIDFVFPNRTLAAGERVVVVNNRYAFTNRYGAAANALVAGEFTGNLANDGNRLVLEGRVREPILDFSYDDDWYPITDGFGFSLVVVDENAPASAWDTKPQWRPSGVLNGTPGQGDGAAPVFPHVVINEALTHSDPPPPTDTIELRNLDGTPADISGWYLTDDFRTPRKYRIPNGTTIPANGYLTFNESQFNTNTSALMPFGLSSRGDEVYLFSADGAGNLGGYFHGFEFGAARAGVTFGRHVNNLGEEHFVSLVSATLGAANANLLIGPVVITEIMYRPPDVLVNGAYWNNSEDEFIELRNISGSAVNLYDAAHPTNRWKLDKAVEFTFPPNTSIPAGGYVVVVNFDPATDAQQLAAFRAKYGISPGIPIYGPYSGSLDNANEDLGLYMPDNPETIGPDAGTVPYVLVDRVRYSDTAPWPPAADGMGHSLQRITQLAYGDDAMNWAAGSPTPGGPLVSGSIPTITQHPTSRTIVGGNSTTFSGLASGTGPIRYQWRVNGNVINGATNSVLVLENVQASQAGEYVLYALNPFGAAMSTPATLEVLVPVDIEAAPASQSVREGTNVTFAVAASSVAPPVSFQWRFNGMNIPGATNASYLIASVTEFDEGVYDVLCTDRNGTLASPPATLTVLIPPSLIHPVPPLSLSAVVGETVTLSARTRGTRPIWTVWRRFDWPTGSGGNIVRQGAVSANIDFLTLTNIGTNAQGRYSMLMTNIAGGALNIQRTNAFLTVLMDSDGDRIPDVWESAHGLDPMNAADAAADSDGDTMSNRNEYIAGTDPADANSYLKVDGIGAVGPATIEFLAVSNRTYSVMFKDDVTGLTWSRLGDVIAHATNRVERVMDPTPVSGRVYRLVTPKQP